MNDLEATVRIGDQAKALVESDLGRYIDGCISQDLEEAKQKLVDLDPYSFTTLPELQNAIAEIQQKVKRSIDLRGYLEEAIVNGQQALHTLESSGD